MGLLLAPAQVGTSLNGVSLAAAAGAGQAFDPHYSNLGVPAIAWQTVYSAAPDAVTVLLEGSLDGTNWFTIDTSTAVGGEIRSVNGSYKSLRINNSAVTNGTGKTLTATLVFSVRKSSADLIVTKFLQRILTAAEASTLNSAPIILTPATSGILYSIDTFLFIKNTTGQFTGGAGKNLIVQWNASTPLAATGSLEASFMDAAAINGKASTPAIAVTNLIGEAATDIGGKALRLFLSSGDLGGTGSVCTVKMWYNELPSAV